MVKFVRVAYVKMGVFVILNIRIVIVMKTGPETFVNYLQEILAVLVMKIVDKLHQMLDIAN